jgi:hypothetical protein
VLTAIALAVAVIALIIAIAARQRVGALERELRVARGPLPVTPAAAPAPQPQAPPASQPAPPPPQAAPPPQQPVSPPPIAAPAAAAPSRNPWKIDWENLVGIKLFSWIAGIALVLAAVFLFKYSVEHGWLRPAVRAAFGLITGIGLLIVCELRVARNYRFTANAMDGAGIAILYATLFAMHTLWHIVPAPVAFIGMLVVTAAAVYLSTRRDSVFIALLGLIGGFATPALLSSNENRPLALFSYLLLLNGGISWIAYRKRWPLLTALSVGLTVFYQWSWVKEFLTTGQLPLAAGIFAVFALVGVSSLWDRHGDERQRLFRVIAQAAAVLPLIFAFFTAVVPEYGARFNVLFGFLLLIALGLAVIAQWRGPAWLHQLGGASTVITFFIWLAVSYTHQSWPWSLLWLAAFVALYLAKTSFASAALFFVFTGLAIREPSQAGTLNGAMLALLAVLVLVAIRKAMPLLAATAIALSSIALMTMAPQLRILFASHVLLFAATLLVAFLFERHFLAVLAIPFYIAMLLTANMPAPDVRLLFAFAPYAMFIAYPLLLGARVKQSRTPHLAACLASAVFFFPAWDALKDLGYKDVIGLLPLAQALVLVVLFWRLLKIERQGMRVALVAGTALAFITAAIPLQFENAWIVMSWSLEAAALAWLYTRVRHAGLLVWSVGLSAVVLGWLLFDSGMHDHRAVFLAGATAMFAAAYLVPALRAFYAPAGTIELFALLNFEISRYYKGASSSLAQDLTYTIAWALFAIAMLVIGIVLNNRGARVAALGLLLVTILKCFLHDLAQLGGLYRVGSLFGLAVSLVLVGLLLQKFVITKSAAAETSHAPTGTT